PGVQLAAFDLGQFGVRDLGVQGVDHAVVDGVAGEVLVDVALAEQVVEAVVDVPARGGPQDLVGRAGRGDRDQVDQGAFRLVEGVQPAQDDVPDDHRQRAGPGVPG